MLPIEDSTAEVNARVRANLRSRGTPTDVWIAALAVEHSLPVVSRDEHFDNVKDLTRVAW